MEGRGDKIFLPWQNEWIGKEEGDKGRDKGSEKWHFPASLLHRSNWEGKEKGKSSQKIPPNGKRVSAATSLSSDSFHKFEARHCGGRRRGTGV